MSSQLFLQDWIMVHKDASSVQTYFTIIKVEMDFGSFDSD